MNTLTVDEVKVIHAAQVARKDAPADFDAKQSTRVLVHADLQVRNPMPCTSLTPDMQAARDRRDPLTYQEHEAQVVHQKAQVTPEQHAAHAAARNGKHPDLVDANGVITVKDAHHHVQKLHGKSLWEETDRLVGQAVPS
jgi:hypothetical protein